ncbi:MAG: type II and III secretion system protein family protein [Phenylobacterium sp.]
MSRKPFALALAAFLAFAAPALAQETHAGAAALAAASAANSAVVRVDLSSGPASQSLALPRGKSAIVELPVDVRDVLVTNPLVADAVLRTPRRIYVLGVSSGQTDAVFFDASGRRLLSLDIRVDQDTTAVAQSINRVLSRADVRVDAMNNSLILSGRVASASDSDKAVQIARAAVPNNDPKLVINMLSITGKDQVMLKVRVVEMQRSVIKQLGFNTSAVLGQLGETQYLLGQVATFGVNGGLLGGFSGGWNTDTTQQPVMQFPCGAPFPVDAMCDVVTRDSTQASNWDTSTLKNTAGSPGLNKGEATLKAFERVGLIRTLAEPNLTAVSGESAKFLAGGEFPVPVGQDDNGRISIEFKPFGVGLGFTPVVLSGGRISLRISTEVSELTNQGSFSISNGAGAPSVTIPALNVRRAETTVELPSGGAMMIAGLLRETMRQNIDGLPALGSLPVLGALFRSRDYLSGETELVVIVTPYLVDAVSPDRLQTPADGLKVASDPETILLGRLNHAYKTKPSAAPAGRTYQGPYGYVIE